MSKPYAEIGFVPGLKVFATPPVFEAHTTPHGFIPAILAAQACWYYYLLADKMLDMADESDQIVLVGEPWYYRRFVQLKKSISLIYGLDSPDDFDRFWECVILEADRCAMPPPKQVYMKASPILKPAGDQSK